MRSEGNDGADGPDPDAEEDRTPDAADCDRARNHCLVVGIGASAGGLEAISALLRRVGPVLNMALVVVQHLLPEHPSMLPELLARVTSVPVHSAEDGMKVEAGRIYVAPPNVALAMLDGALHFMDKSAGAARLPIDFFFRSLADDAGRRAVGVVLSGTGTDGTSGLKAIKDAGGVTFAQDPATAKFDGMPHSAQESGAADYCLSPELIAEELGHVGERSRAAGLSLKSPQFRDGVGRLLLLIRNSFGSDFSAYKPNTIERRIERRLALNKIDNLDDYLRFVQANPDELTTLHKDLLIGVTSFFRDREPFEVLKSQILPAILQGKRPGAPIRIWVPACSTGEEAYSVAITLIEALDDRTHDYRIQIFATDLDHESIEHARRGTYPESISLDVSPERLQRFFVRKEDGYRIGRRVRDMVVFSVQNMVKDAPFSRLDLVTCRNLLIYLQPVLQKRVLVILHYALNPAGYLMLGTSETVGDSSELFSVVDRSNKIYMSKALTPVGFVDLKFGSNAPEKPPVIQPGAGFRPAASVGAIADRKILEMFGPPGVVVNEELEILHFRGRTGAYLDPAPGAASLNILRLARTDIQPDLRRVLRDALSQNAPVEAECKINEAGKQRAFRLQVVPISEPETQARCLLVLFHEPASEEPRPPPPQDLDPSSPLNNRIQELERELLVTKEYLQSTIEELEGANEEQKSANEELQSANEELQSTNEELETSKEELQSANEELTTVNDELQMRMTEQQQTLDDLHNVMGGVDNAVIITGMDFKIRRFTLAAERTFNLTASDVGRSVNQLGGFFGGLRLEHLCAEVIESLTPLTRELLGSDQRWYSLRIAPYRTLEHSITGALVVFADIDLKKRALQLGQDVREYANMFLDVSAQPLLLVGENLRVVWASTRLCELFALEPGQVSPLGLSLLRVGPWAERALSEKMEGLQTIGASFSDLELECDLPRTGKATLRIAGRRVPPIGGEQVLVLLSLNYKAPD